MITFTNIRYANSNDFDEIWAIVRSLKSNSTKLTQVQALSPSKNLFFMYRNMVKTNNWNHNTFESIYVPTFLKEMHSDEAIAALNKLYQLDKAGKNIACVCFCTDETECHRSIVAGLLQGVGCNVKIDSGNNYSHYYTEWKNITT